MASAQPRNGVWEGEGKRNNRRLQSSVGARSWRPAYWIVPTRVEANVNFFILIEYHCRDPSGA
jgi:hypothetical protein